MAGGSGLTVVITADITTLQTKLAAARAAFNSTNGELRKMAQEAQKSGQTLNALDPAVQKLSASVAANAREVRGLASELRGKLNPELDNSGKKHKVLQGVIGQNRVAFNELTHSVRAVADGLAAGINPMTLFSEEFFRVGQAMTEFNTVSATTLIRFGLIGAAVVAAGAAVYELAEHFARLRAEADLGTRMEALGHAIPIEQIHQMSTELRLAGHTIDEMGDNTAAARNKIIASFAELKYGGSQLAQALTDLAPDFAHATGTPVQEAVQHLVRDMNDLSGSGERTMEAFGLTDQKLSEFQQAAAENPKQAIVQYLDVVTQRLNTMSASMDNVRQTSHGLMATLDDLASGKVFGVVGSTLGTTIAEQRQAESKDRNAQTSADVGKGIAAVPNNLAPDLGGVAEQTKGIADREILSRTNDQILQDQAANIKKILDSDRMGASERIALQRQYADMQVEIAKASSSEEARTIEINARKAASAAGAVRKDEVEAELGVLRQGLNNVKLTAEEKRNIQEQIAQLEIRDVRATASEAKKTAQEQWEDQSAQFRNAITDARGNYAEQLKIAQQWVAAGKALFGAHIHNYEDAISKLDELQKQQAESTLKAAEALSAARKDMAEGQANLDAIGSKGTPGEFKGNIGLVFDTSKLNAQVDKQIAALKARLDEDVAGLQKDATFNLNLGTAQGAEKAAADFKQMTADMEQFATQAKAINERAAQAVTQAWEKITGPIGNAFDSITEAVIKGGKNERQEVDRALESILESYIKSTVKMIANWGAMELQKTALTYLGIGMRTTAEAPAEAKSIADLAKALAAFTATETAKTTATATGAAARAAAQGAGVAAQVAQNASSISGNAGVAAAGAYAATAAIPIVGPEMAPAAAAQAYATVMSFNVASAEGGWDRVPFDGAPAVLHKDEMVLPRGLAQGVRDMTANGVNLPRPGVNSTLAGSAAQITNHSQSSLNLSPSTTINMNGLKQDQGEVRSAINRAHADLHSTAQGWYAKNQVGLPGKQTWGRGDSARRR